MKRTLLALFLAETLTATSAWALEGNDSPAPPPAPMSPAAPLPPMAPLPPLPAMDRQSAAGSEAKLAVKGPVTLRADAISAEIEVVRGSDKEVKAQLIDSSSGAIRLNQNGSRVEVVFSATSGWPHIPAGIDGKLRVELPAGSNVELTSASGDIHVRDVGGNVRLRSASGDAVVKKAANVEAQLVSGDILVEDASGEVRLRTVSGDAQVSQNASAARLEFGTTSGDLVWAGNCNSNCRIEARTTSGDVKLQMPRSSSFDLRYLTHSGDFSDGMKVQTLERGESSGVHARLGNGDGCIEVQTFSGDLTIAHR